MSTCQSPRAGVIAKFMQPTETFGEVVPWPGTEDDRRVLALKQMSCRECQIYPGQDLQGCPDEKDSSLLFEGNGLLCQLVCIGVMRTRWSWITSWVGRVRISQRGCCRTRFLSWAWLNLFTTPMCSFISYLGLQAGDEDPFLPWPDSRSTLTSPYGDDYSGHVERKDAKKGPGRRMNRW